MTSVYKEVSYILEELKTQIQEVVYRLERMLLENTYSERVRSVEGELDHFLSEFKFLILIDGIHKWTEAQAVLPRLATKIEATILEIATQVKGETFRNFEDELLGIRFRCDRRSIFFRWANFLKKASEIVDALANLRGKFNLLKPEIFEAGKNWLDQPFQSHFLMADSFNWGYFVSTINSCLEKCSLEIDDGDPRRKVRDLCYHLGRCRIHLDDLLDVPSAQDFPIYIANVAIRAAPVVCRWWASQFDSRMKDDVTIALLNLQREIDLTQPKHLGQIFRLLKTVRTTSSPFRRDIDLFLFVIRPQIYNEISFSLNTGIRALANSIIPFIPDEDAEDEQCFLLDFSLLISEIKEYSSCSLLENGSLSVNLLAEVLLMHIEVFIVEQLTTGNDLISKELQIGSFEDRVQEIKEIQEKHNVNVNQIFTLVEVAAKLLTSHHHSLHAKDITRSMVRTMLYSLRLNILHWKLDRKFNDNSGSLALVVKERVQYFIEGLKFLSCCFINQQGVIVKDGVLEVAWIEAMTRSAILLYRSLLTQNMTGDDREDEHF